MRAAQIEGLGSSGEVVDLRWFIRGLPADEQQWLKAWARGWGPILARVVGDAVNIEEAGRRRAIATRRRRIAARAAKMQAAAVKRKQNQASSMVHGHLR